MATLERYLRAATARLEKAGVDSPRLSAQILARHALGARIGAAAAASAGLFCCLEARRELTADETARLDALMARRAQGRPVAHLTGSREFYGRDFLVTGRTLIPRPETELLVETALEILPAAPLAFVDMGAGTGCIGLTLAAERPAWRGLLLELDGGAAAVCVRNATRLGLAGRVAVARGDMRRPPLRRRAFGLVVANPPYVSEAERGDVMDEVLAFEPHAALFSPENGLAHLRAAAGAAWRALMPGGHVLLEHGAGQGAAVRELLAAQGFVDIGSRRDLAGRERCALARRGEQPVEAEEKTPGTHFPLAKKGQIA